MDFSAFYTDTTNFEAYSVEHFCGVFAMFVFGVWFLYMGKYKWTKAQQWKYAKIFTIALIAIQLFKTFIRLYLGTMDPATDLPLQLCNMLPFLMLFALIRKSRMLLSVIFFWILAGTAQANITPTLLNELPHYEAIRYWMIHMGLPILAIYSFYVLGFRYTFRDVVRSALGLNVMAAIIYPINYFLDANYLYLNAKPPPGTIYDLLGPWPWYIMSLEGVMLILFSIVLIPFLVYHKLRGHTVTANQK